MNQVQDEHRFFYVDETGDPGFYGKVSGLLSGMRAVRARLAWAFCGLRIRMYFARDCLRFEPRWPPTGI